MSEAIPYRKGFSPRHFFYLLLAAAILGSSAWIPSPVSAQGSEDLRGIIKVLQVKRTLSKETVAPGEAFTGRVEAAVLFNKPFSLNLEVSAEYEIFGRHTQSAQEIVLGKGEKNIGPYPDLKEGDRLDFDETFSLIFPPGTELGTYTVLARPKRVSPWFLWLAIGNIVPQEARMGTIEVVPSRPTPVPPQSVTALIASLHGFLPWVLAPLLLAALAGGLFLWKRGHPPS